MSSPLVPVLANIFMALCEFYLKYVDILAAFDNEQDSLNF